MSRPSSSVPSGKALCVSGAKKRTEVSSSTGSCGARAGAKSAARQRSTTATAPKNAGRWFFDHLSSLRPSRRGDGVFPQQVDALWDSYLLFDRDAMWKDTPSGLMSWGYTVLRTRDKLLDDFRVSSRPARPGQD